MQAGGLSAVAGGALHHTRLRHAAVGMESWGPCGHPLNFTVGVATLIDA